MIPYEMVNGMTNDAVVPGNNWYFSGITRTHLTAETAVEIHEHLLKVRASHSLLGDFVMMWEYYPLAQKIKSVKSDAMAFRMRTADLGCLLGLRWDGSVKDEKVKVKAKELVTEHRLFCEKLVKAQKGYLQRAEADKDIAYGNYGKLITPTGRAPITNVRVLEMLDGRAIALFGANYPRLQKLKAKYDPTGVFSKWYPIQPSLT
jgi:hypothetical protein